MPYVERDAESRIKGVYEQPQPGYAEEWLDDAQIEHPLDAVRMEASGAVLAAVSAARTKYAAPAAFQDLIFNMKLAEAQAYVSTGRPADTSPFTILSASAAGRSKSVSEEADAVLATASAWIAISAETERLRLAGQKAITEAQTAEAIEQARDAHVAQLNAL